LTPEQKEWKKEGTIGVAGNRGEKKGAAKNLFFCLWFRFRLF
jgi:hypothetical protein